MHVLSGTVATSSLFFLSSPSSSSLPTTNSCDVYLALALPPRLLFTTLVGFSVTAAAAVVAEAFLATDLRWLGLMAGAGVISLISKLESDCANLARLAMSGVRGDEGLSDDTIVMEWARLRDSARPPRFVVVTLPSTFTVFLAVAFKVLLRVCACKGVVGTLSPASSDSESEAVAVSSAAAFDGEAFGDEKAFDCTRTTPRVLSE